MLIPGSELGDSQRFPTFYGFPLLDSTTATRPSTVGDDYHFICYTIPLHLLSVKVVGSEIMTIEILLKLETQIQMGVFNFLTGETNFLSFFVKLFISH